MDVYSHSQSQPLSAVGVIAEYNPFHNGHAYHLRQAKETSGARFCVVVMSGDFVQRGAPAIYDKYLRTEAALRCGADLVLEMPPAFALSSARDFAACGVSLLDRLGVVTHLCFGMEEGDPEAVSRLARFLLQEPEAVSAPLQQALKRGHSYPKALADAVAAVPPDTANPAAAAAPLLSRPNTILAVEYEKALLARHSPILPLPIRREGSGYHDTRLSDAPNPKAGPGAGFSSASAIRSALAGGTAAAALAHQVPAEVLPLMETAVPLFPGDFTSMLLFRLLEMERQQIPPERFWDVPEGLAGRIRRGLLRFSSIEQLTEELNTRAFTASRVRRALMHILLDIRTEDVLLRKSRDYGSFVRVLGFRKDAAPLLSAIKKASALTLVVKTADAPQILDPEALSFFRQVLYASHVYQAALAGRTGRPVPNEYTRSPVRVG